MTRNKKTLAAILVVFSFSLVLWACVSPHQTFDKLPPGIWRGVLYLDGELIMAVDKKDIAQVSAVPGELPFTFEVKYGTGDSLEILVYNGSERVSLKNIRYGRDKATAKDTVYASFDGYDTYLAAIFEERLMEGYWHVNYRDGYKIKFKAFYGDDRRFRLPFVDDNADFSGRYKVSFSTGTEKEYPAIGDFVQKGNKLYGTFLTETGDYRFLEGNVSGDKASLSCFDGAHAYLFEMKKQGDAILGEFRSGTHHRESFEGVKDENASLTNGFNLVKIVQPNGVRFVLPDTKGKTVDTQNDPYKGKVKVYEIMGSWCPNCMDATTFLTEYQKSHPEVMVTALAFERYQDPVKAMAALKTYVDAKKIEYPVLLAGHFDKKTASTLIPQIEGIKAYPTLLLVDQNDRLVKVYSGFYGPATKEHAAFIKELSATIDGINRK
ncbi:MAG TPA: TlpA disulfide reductase family protein [Saprospiraceae bacterium]|nr:TlpA disulfide reductase family protein [Saprospiraceae bacterium]HRG64493.1 TlpA disulfide reductase family protein [Saprospiraceae bacterium]